MIVNRFLLLVVIFLVITVGVMGAFLVSGPSGRETGDLLDHVQRINEDLEADRARTQAVKEEAKRLVRNLGGDE